MPRIDVPFVVENQHITQPTGDKLVSGGQNYFYATFEIKGVWEKISNIKAVFVRDAISILVDLIETDGGYECQIPWEVMDYKGAFQVGVFGGNRMLTDYTYVIVKQGCVVDGEVPSPPTPDWFGKVDTEIKELESNKAAKDDTYTKEEAESLVAKKINNELTNYYNITEVENYVDEQTEIIKADIEGIQEDIKNEAHFRGYVSTNAKIQELRATPNDFVYSAESGTVWVYDEVNGWVDSGTPVPDKATPLSNATPLINGEASSGTSEEGARSDHRHPTDTTRLSVAEFNEFKIELETSLDNIITKYGLDGDVE